MAMEHKEEEIPLEENKEFMDLQSRTIAALGLDVVAQLTKLRVMIVGLKDVGIEAAKNLALTGPQQITLVDGTSVRDACGNLIASLHASTAAETRAQPRHLGTNFFLTAEDVGKPISAGVLDKLKGLNRSVAFRAIPRVTDDELVQHDAVIVTEGSQAEIKAWDVTCRTARTSRRGRPVAFHVAMNLGLAGFVFTDFGPEFVIKDASGAPMATRVIEDISSDGVVTLAETFTWMADATGHYGWVKFSGVQGMTRADGRSINDFAKVRIATVLDDDMQPHPQKFRINVSAGFSPYVKGGTITEVRNPYEAMHRSFEENLTMPASAGSAFCTSTGAAANDAALHFAYQAIAEFQDKSGGRSPSTADEVQAVVSNVIDMNKTNRALNASAGQDVALAVDVERCEEDPTFSQAVTAAVQWSGSRVQPVCAVLGGIVAQEVVKVTGKGTPINQLLYVDFFDAAPDAESLTPGDTDVEGSRYDDIIAIWGKSFQRKLANSRTFMVGCGAIGCEALKNFAMLGVGTGPEGRVTTTDGDTIEVSNLNRQFLFHDVDVGRHKSDVAVQKAVEMNPDLTGKVVARTDLVSSETEDIFHDEFWADHTFLVNALDNVKARRYVDSKAVRFRLPLFESGTEGTACSTLPVIPHLTTTYEDEPTPRPTGIPMCTLRSFPNLIEHCIEWGRGQFTDLFQQPYTVATAFCTDPATVLMQLTEDVQLGGATEASAVETMHSLVRTLTIAQKPSFSACVKEARRLFNELFHDNICKLLREFPPELVDATGKPFWSGSKVEPLPLELNLADETHMAFLISAANILAANFGIVPPPQRGRFEPLDSRLRSPETVKDALAEDSATDAAQGGETCARDCGSEDLLVTLRKLSDSCTSAKVFPAEFEKDWDENFHIDFITAASNLRARNYKIKEAKRHDVKVIAGKIIPALSTTTSVSTGLIFMEMIKFLLDKPVAAYRRTFTNLSVNNYQWSHVYPARQALAEDDGFLPTGAAGGRPVRPVPNGFTKWDQLVLVGPMTVGDFVDSLMNRTGADVVRLVCSHPCATEVYGPDSTDVLDKSMSEHCAAVCGDHVAGGDSHSSSIELLAECSGATEDGARYDIRMPRLLYSFGPVEAKHEAAAACGGSGSGGFREE